MVTKTLNRVQSMVLYLKKKHGDTHINFYLHSSESNMLQMCVCVYVCMCVYTHNINTVYKLCVYTKICIYTHIYTYIIYTVYLHAGERNWAAKNYR